ncbi:hypothetical protein U27_03200 [Candidatus Vecturithrix granuli]|uniref:Uncharacterized protein n=1 Tax=Vecturithrix granuli TaxID=1499967 RepID=A0A081BV83_VECG1|nr:hypothetical protein U27_03200 [Candidatus Vecturithrix granuli]
MTFINHQELGPVALKIVMNLQVVLIAFQTGILQVRMKPDRIIEAVILKAGILFRQILAPVLFQFFGAQQNDLKAFQLEKLHDR